MKDEYNAGDQLDRIQGLDADLLSPENNDIMCIKT